MWVHVERRCTPYAQCSFAIMTCCIMMLLMLMMLMMLLIICSSLYLLLTNSFAHTCSDTAFIFFISNHPHLTMIAVGPANHIGICGAAPSDDPEYCLWLVRNGISSVSLSADAFASTFLHVAHAYAHDEGAEVSHGVTAISTDTVPAPTPTSTHIYAPASVRSKDAEPARVNISRPPHRCHAAAEDVSRAASAG